MINMMPVELNGTLIKELRGRTCRILSNEGWTQSNLGNALGVSQVMAGNYLHTLPKKYSEPTESNLQEASVSLADILKLKPRLFDWKEGEGSNEKNVSGFVAQECEAAGFDEFVGDFKHDTLTDAKSFGAGGLITAAIKAIQEQQVIIDDLKARIETLEG
mgnify:CR=1 FL=1